MTRPRIALCSRELFPFGGGGIGAYVAQVARTLAPVADVTLLTADWYQEKYHELAALGDPRVDYGGADLAFVAVPEPADYGGFYSHMHLYAHRALSRLREVFGDVGPDLIEFPDYLGEGFSATQAKRTGDPFLASTVIAVRLHTSAELCDVLNGHLERSFEQRITRELERRTLRDADVLLQAGGDVLGTYRRFYGDALAPARLVRHPLEWQPHPERERLDGPLRMLYVGRCERRKGVQDLLSALTAFTADWRLTVLGADTGTAPLGASMRRTLQLQAADDPRIRFEESVARAELPAEMRRHDIVVLPSRWECWPYVALEAMAAGVPVVAPAVGGCVELIRPGATGWLAAAPGPHGLMETLGPLVAEPARVRDADDPGARDEHLRRLTDPDVIRADYLELARVEDHHARPRPREEPPPLVSVVVPYFDMSRWVESAVASIFAQTYPRLEVLVVDDGSFFPEDVLLAELAARYPVRVLVRPNGGLGAARNFGISQARGRYVLPLDADNVLSPSFVTRCVALLEADDELPFVTTWNRYVDEDGIAYPPPNEGYRPIGNWSALVHERNVAGDGTAVLRRRLFDRHRYSEDLVSFEDWAFYRTLHDDGLHGAVIPEALWDYRVRAQSMLREVGMRSEERLVAEMDAIVRDEGMTWVSKSA